MPRGRPRKTDPEEALEAAMTLFWEKGFDGTSMSDLTEATGMAKPGLYANFGDKEALYAKALDHYFNALGKPLLDDFCNHPGDYRAAIRSILETVADAVTGGDYPCGCFVANSLVENSHLPESLGNLGKDLDGRRRDAFHQRLSLAKTKGELSQDAEIDSLADYFSGQVLALAVMGRAGTDRAVLQNFVNTALSVLPERG
ncbi:TetR/AcrR family transcriptional regulator [Aestuariispira insulae]|uniref:TetR family transcriptional regulator n=1 Tax=Aestuariispira insulae TaxID=1461337 RepID=A0A3D9HWZ9_9PROT|nr:TetR/AcrR family transcriptional regulator [Aestuariispira insulae]RED53930.1 TetR family transcriptional regulator [Aestuariispira insulae]